MSRLEIALWTAVMIGLYMGRTAKGDHLYAGPPVMEANAVAVELCREAAALSYDAQRMLARCDDYDDVLEELCDLADELDDLNRTLREASLKPRKWNRLCKRAEDVLEEVCELDEEVHEAVDDLNRHRPRRTAFVPSVPTNYRTRYQPTPQVSIAFRLGTGNTRVVEHVSPITPDGIPVSTPYRGAAEGFANPRVGWELENRVHRMRALAEELHRLAHAG